MLKITTFGFFCLFAFVGAILNYYLIVAASAGVIVPVLCSGEEVRFVGFVLVPLALSNQSHERVCEDTQGEHRGKDDEVDGEFAVAYLRCDNLPIHVAHEFLDIFTQL